jgi:hypothetical protein
LIALLLTFDQACPTKYGDLLHFSVVKGEAGSPALL